MQFKFYIYIYFIITKYFIIQLIHEMFSSSSSNFQSVGIRGIDKKVCVCKQQRKYTLILCDELNDKMYIILISMPYCFKSSQFETTCYNQYNFNHK